MPFFEVMGSRPTTGRAFLEEDQRVDAPPVVVVSQRVWGRQSTRAPNISRVTLDGVAHNVAGVMPAAFAFPDRAIRPRVSLGERRDSSRRPSTSSSSRGNTRARRPFEAACRHLTPSCRRLTPCLRPACRYLTPRLSAFDALVSAIVACPAGHVPLPSEGRRSEPYGAKS